MARWSPWGSLSLAEVWERNLEFPVYTVVLPVPLAGGEIRLDYQSVDVPQPSAGVASTRFGVGGFYTTRLREHTNVQLINRLAFGMDSAKHWATFSPGKNPGVA